MLIAPVPPHADPLGSNMTPAGPVPGVGELDRGNTWSRQPMPGHPSQRDGWARSRWGPNHDNGSWGYHPAWGGPYTVWGGAYVPYVWGGVAVPYRRYGDWGSLEYPYSEWREPFGGWGNP